MIDGALIRPLFEALDVDVRDVASVNITPPNVITVVVYLRDEDDRFYAVSGEPAMKLIREQVRW